MGTGGASAGGGTGGTGGGSGGSGEAGQELARGNDPLIDLFVTEAGVLIVSSRSVARVTREGELLNEIAAPREVTAAAFDGETLVIADKAFFTSYDASLAVQASAPLVETCAAAVVVDQGRFVCGPANDWDRIFYTYDIVTGALLGTSSPYTYNGIPMRRIPGTQDFVTVTTDSSPSDFHLYSVGSGGGQDLGMGGAASGGSEDEVVFINESPYHGDFRVTDVYSFYGEPATHLVTDTGLLLEIRSDGCNGSTWPSQCFVKDGTLGTLSGQDVFLAMDATPSGQLAALAGTAGYFSDPACADGCFAQLIDVDSRTIVNQRTYQLEAGSIVVGKHDAVSQSLVVGYRLPGSLSSAAPYPGYRVALLRYSSDER